MAEPFNPFSFIEDDDDQNTNKDSFSVLRTQPVTPANRTCSPRNSLSQTTVTNTTDPNVTFNTTNTTFTSQSQQQQGKPTSIPPRLSVRFSLNEEVSSSSVVGINDACGASLSQLFIEGKIHAQVSSSDAIKSTPFCVKLSGPMASLASVKCCDYCDLERAEDEASYRRTFVVDIPKSKFAGCEIIKYNMNVKTQNMPILVQTKASMTNKRVCRIGVQIRSNLSNQGGLSNVTIVVAIPSTLQGSTIKITRGENFVWDELKRTVTWKLGNLPHGHSCLVSLEAEIISSLANLLARPPPSQSGVTTSNMKSVEGKIHFPVLVRCASDVDQISDMKLTAAALGSTPASVVFQKTQSFTLLHRVMYGEG